jgi:hypothetical protein
LQLFKRNGCQGRTSSPVLCYPPFRVLLSLPPLPCLAIHPSLANKLHILARQADIFGINQLTEFLFWEENCPFMTNNKNLGKKVNNHNHKCAIHRNTQYPCRSVVNCSSEMVVKDVRHLLCFVIPPPVFCRLSLPPLPCLAIHPSLAHKLHILYFGGGPVHVTI